MSVRVSVEREGPSVVLALRDDRSGAHATVELHRRESASLAASVAAVSGPEDEDTELECTFKGRLTVAAGKTDT